MKTKEARKNSKKVAAGFINYNSEVELEVDAGECPIIQGNQEATLVAEDLKCDVTETEDGRPGRKPGSRDRKSAELPPGPSPTGHRVQNAYSLLSQAGDKVGEIIMQIESLNIRYPHFLDWEQNFAGFQKNAGKDLEHILEGFCENVAPGEALPVELRYKPQNLTYIKKILNHVHGAKWLKHKFVFWQDSHQRTILIYFRPKGTNALTEERRRHLRQHSATPEELTLMQSLVESAANSSL